MPFYMERVNTFSNQVNEKSYMLRELCTTYTSDNNTLFNNLFLLMTILVCDVNTTVCLQDCGEYCHWMIVLK